MRSFRLTVGLIPTAALLAALSIAAPAGASGYWNVPSSFCQCMGCGWGAGYHAPLVLGPITCANWCSHNEVRVRHAPASPYVFCDHCSDCCGDFNDASQLTQPVMHPAQSTHAAPQPPAPTRAIFGAPVEP